MGCIRSLDDLQSWWMAQLQDETELSCPCSPVSQMARPRFWLSHILGPHWRWNGLMSKTCCHQHSWGSLSVSDTPSCAHPSQLDANTCVIYSMLSMMYSDFLLVPWLESMLHGLKCFQLRPGSKGCLQGSVASIGSLASLSDEYRCVISFADDATSQDFLSQVFWCHFGQKTVYVGSF